MFKFSQRSLDKLQGVHPDIVRVMEEAIKETTIDFGIVQGVRTQAEQDALYEQGRTKPGPIVTWTRKSKHIKQADGYGHAVDIAAFIKGKITWAPAMYDDLAVVIKGVANRLKVPLKWGPEIGIKGDLGHYEL